MVLGEGQRGGREVKDGTRDSCRGRLEERKYTLSLFLHSAGDSEFLELLFRCCCQSLSLSLCLPCLFFLSHSLSLSIRLRLSSLLSSVPV